MAERPVRQRRPGQARRVLAGQAGRPRGTGVPDRPATRRDTDLHGRQRPLHRRARGPGAGGRTGPAGGCEPVRRPRRRVLHAAAPLLRPGRPGDRLAGRKPAARRRVLGDRPLHRHAGAARRRLRRPDLPRIGPPGRARVVRGVRAGRPAVRQTGRGGGSGHRPVTLTGLPGRVRRGEHGHHDRLARHRHIARGHPDRRLSVRHELEPGGAGGARRRRTPLPSSSTPTSSTPRASPGSPGTTTVCCTP